MTHLFRRRRWATFWDLTTWDDRPDYWPINDEFGNCHTAWGHEHNVSVICGLGGIGCNVNHVAVKRRNERERRD